MDEKYSMDVLKYVWDVLKAILPFLKFPWVTKKLSGVSIRSPLHNSLVNNSWVTVGGKYRWLLGMRLVLFHVEDNLYWPQGQAVLNPTGNSWTQGVSIGTVKGRQYHIVVAGVTDDFLVATNYYGQVHQALLKDHKLDVWIPLTMFPNQLPPGFIELDRVIVTFA
jgi:hypothetical protein